MDIWDLHRIADKNDFTGNIIQIDNNEHKVRVMLVNGQGYEYAYFNDVKISWDLKLQEKKLYLEFVENG